MGVAEETGKTWLEPFVRASCSTGRCPQYLSWHFYVSGCYDSDDKLQDFGKKMDDSMKLIKELPSIKGILLTELGLLKLEGGPATCPDSILVSVVKKLFAIMRRPEYAVQEQSIVKHIAWFSKDGDGSTYDLALVDPSSGHLRPVGSAYSEECSQWTGSSGPVPTPVPTPSPTPSQSLCPGGSMSACTNLCPQEPKAYNSCVVECSRRCEKQIVV